MPDFRAIRDDDKVYLFDGAYGTLLQARGLPAGVSPEHWGLARPDVLAAVHADYFAAGSRILTTNTFGGTAPKLGSGSGVRQMNRDLAAIARRVAGDAAYVAGSVGPTGLFVEPLGPLSLREMVALYAEQIRGLVEGGVDCIKAETHFDLAEARAVVIAAREVCDLPVIVSMTFEAGRSLTGSTPRLFVETMQNMGVDVVGVNCSSGPDEFVALVEEMGKSLEIPLHVQPNAGIPRIEGGCTVFPVGPEEFGRKAARFVAMGAKFLAGCCGTGPDHIRALSRAVEGATWTRPAPTSAPRLVATSRIERVPFDFAAPAVIIGERINPTGKKLLTEEFQSGLMDEAERLAGEQLAQGARVLDVNVGAPMVKEAEFLPALVRRLAGRVQAPLCIDTADPAAAEAALWAYPGSALLNSISGEEGKLETLGPLCRKFGAPFILLPLAGRKLPRTSAERIALLDGLLAKAEDLGIPRRLIMVDALVLTVSSVPGAARACLELIRHCRDVWGLPTTMGLSNISFGLPARELLNATFLGMCLAEGATSFIANPASHRLTETLNAAEVLLARDERAERFIAGYAEWKSAAPVAASGAAAKSATEAATLREAVVLGASAAIVPMLDKALAEGADAFALMREELIPGILDVGGKYERREYFLPQLMLSAETMQKGFARLKPLLEKDEDSARRTVVVMATVEGDIHDIGKNIVCLMLKNHGFEVVDLGKDVPAERIVAAARKHGARVIGLSALMTTTMVRMEDVVRLVKSEGLDCSVMVGGAVVTQAYADAIGADGYAQDAVAAARLASRLASPRS